MLWKMQAETTENTQIIDDPTYSPFKLSSLNYFILAKIILPACVCNTELTSTSVVVPIARLPFSTTIMVPSSR